MLGGRFINFLPPLCARSHFLSASGIGISTRIHTLKYSNKCTFAHLKKVHSEWCSKPLSEFGQKLIPGSRRAANYTLISLLDDRRRHEDHILGTMHTQRGFCLGWLNMDTFLEKCEGRSPCFQKIKFHIKTIYLKLFDDTKMQFCGGIWVVPLLYFL